MLMAKSDCEKKKQISGGKSSWKMEKAATT
jgi:hypothetical protein